MLRRPIETQLHQFWKFFQILVTISFWGFCQFSDDAATEKVNELKEIEAQILQLKKRKAEIALKESPPTKKSKFSA